MQRSRRSNKAIDYRIFHRTGEIVYKEVAVDEHTEESVYLEMSEAGDKVGDTDPGVKDATLGKESKMVLELQALSDDVVDFIDENPVADMADSTGDLEAAIKRMEEFRSLYRSKQRILVASFGDLYDDEDSQHKMKLMKKYILQCKDARRNNKSQEESEKKREMSIRGDTFLFILDDTNRLIKNLETEMKVVAASLSEKELLERSKELNDIEQKVKDVANKITELLTYSSADGKDEWEVKTIKKRYEDLVITKTNYIFQIKKDVRERELDKVEIFKEAKLNIKIQKFKGYGSSVDIFSFQSQFEKIYSRTTPKRLMPDLLKNTLLEDSPLALVKDLDEIDEIWSRLKKAYGDPKLMMNRRMEELYKIGVLWKIKESGRLIDALQKIVNVMKGLMNLSETHNIENELYYGDGLERVFKLLGDRRLEKWIQETCERNLSRKDSWSSVIESLEKETRILQQKKIFLGRDEIQKRQDDSLKAAYVQRSGDQNTSASNLRCDICGETGHVDTPGPNSSRVIQYFMCKRFAEMTPAQRFNAVKSKGLCFQCLLPGARANEGKHKYGSCQHDFACKHQSHTKYPRSKHVLLCEEHKAYKENVELLENYKSKCILKDKGDVPCFSKEIKLSFVTESAIDVNESSARKLEAHLTETTEKAIYQLQRIKVDGQSYLVFYDNGCGEFACTYDAVRRLGSRSTQERQGPVPLGGVGGTIIESPHGIYSVTLPLCNGEEAKFSGTCLDAIASEFPKYPLQGDVEADIHEAYRRIGGNPGSLPKLSRYVGGATDFLIGIKYLRYHPEKVFQLPSGLAIYKSMFKNADGGRGVIGGPHEVFTAIERQFYLESNHLLTFLCNQEKLYRNGFQINPDISLLGLRDAKLEEVKVEAQNLSQVHMSRAEVNFDAAENAGSQITYRCVRCRSCKDCKDAKHIEERSIKEEVEEDVISRSVTVDVKNRQCVATLPLMYDPVKRLMPNKQIAMKVYQQQVKKLSKNLKDKEDVLKSERKLHDAGFVEYVRNLPNEQQKNLKMSPLQNFIPWRSVWKETSISTPCRLVFDASQTTSSGYSLNNILAKGKNNMNVLQEIFIRWSIHQVAFHTDVQKMYNCVKLKEEDWCLQRYLWQEDLNPDVMPEEKVIKTLIYGVVSSGNIAERCIRETAKIAKDDYPEVNEIVHKDIYVDDCISGERTLKLAKQRADELEVVFNRGGFSLKGVAFSGEVPPETLSDDAETITVAGQKWYTKEDKISLNLGEMKFVKKKRGKTPEGTPLNKVPEKLTRRHCVSKVAEIFDLTGKFTPLTSGMKVDLHELIQRKLQWDDVLPDNLRSIWINHFQMIQEMKHIKYKRAVVPPDAANLEVETICFGDASKSVLCVSIYARFLRRNGTYSCQLVLARSRLIPDGMSQPRAELYAALVNTHSGKIVERAFYKYHKSSMMLTDSQIVLYWITNEEKQLKLWVRNRVIEIRRFTEQSSWYYVDSKNMIADLGTRKGCTLSDVEQGSTWINGYEWMSAEVASFPVKRVNEIILSQEEKQRMKGETPYIDPKKDEIHSGFVAVTRSVPDEVKERYQFSQYLIDPNRRNFQMVVRILATVIRFIKILRQRIQKNVRRIEPSDSKVIISSEDVKDAERYFFSIATREVKHFCKESYGRFSKEQDGILRYTGRILPAESVDVITPMTDVMKDLTATSFCVPIIDKHSPLAYSIVNQYHWNDKVVKHRGVETTLRYILKYAYIIEGRELVKKIRKACQRCRFLAKKTIEVSMGPVSKHNMTIAPAFYITQADLAGPFKAYAINKRSTMKIWLVVFCCATTTTTSIKVMEDYSSPSFIQAFVRFSCDVGYPKVLLVDSGSQILSSCDNMKINFQDLKFRLHHDVDVEFEVVPVGGHYMNGKVERKIQEIRRSLEVNVQNERLSLLQWETMAAEIANRINDLPLALGNITSGFESMDLITPNRLRMGRNNDRSPTSSITVTNDASKIIDENNKIFNTWFEHWLISHVPKLMHQPKWFRIDHDINIGDIVLFTKHDSILSTTYQYGMVHDVKKSKDDIIRKVTVKYRNHQEGFDRLTYRPVRELVMIHPMDELNIVQELGEIANYANYQYALQHAHTK